MNLSRFIAHRFKEDKARSFSKTVGRLAIVSIALGVCVLNLSFSILEGFKTTISDKIFGVDGHIEVTYNDDGEQFNVRPLSTDSSLYKDALSIEGIKSVYGFSEREGIVKHNETVHGVKVKGFNEGFPMDHFAQMLDSGRVVDIENTKEVMISRFISNKLQLFVGDTFGIYFFNKKNFRPQRLIVTGVYYSGLENFDEVMLVGSIGLINKLNKWNDDQVGGYGLFLDDINDVDTVAQRVFYRMDMDMEYQKITDKYFQIFDWLNIIRQNVDMMIVFVGIVVVFSILSTIFILILERTNMIGTLKSLGATNLMLGKVFWWVISSITLKGMVLGNVITLAFCWLQDTYKLIPLDQKNYYMDYVPIGWDWEAFAWVNVGMAVAIALIEAIPLASIVYIKPIKSIRFN